MNRALTIGLAAAGPLFVGVLRFVLPWYSKDGAAAAAAVAAHPGRESLVLWCGLGAILTLVPGLFALWHHMPGGKLRDTAFSLATIGYLAMPGLLVADDIYWIGAQRHLDPATTGQLADAVHPSVIAQMALYVPPHVIGVILIGVLALRHRLVPSPVAWALVVSQPIHFATAVFLGLPWLDLVAWSMTALGMVWLAASCVPATVRVRGLATQPA